MAEVFDSDYSEEADADFAAEPASGFYGSPSAMPSVAPRMSLTQFARRLESLINYSGEVTNQWVIAELSDFRRNGPHAYGQLIEKDAAGRTVASIRATMWQRSLQEIHRKFQAATGMTIASGMKVSVCVTATYHALYGLSANITDIDPSYSLGDMERIRREILERLEKEGVFHCNRQLPLTPVPQKIAVISAEGAAGYGDFMNQLSGMPYKVYPLLYRAVMQGDRTVPTILNALDLIEENADFWDAVVIIRGGGATNDLNSFDNYDLARRVATFPLPVIVGIGHERDNTVLDYIAHTRCKTPTAVAAFIADRLAEADARCEEAGRRVLDMAKSMLAAERQHLAQFESLVPVVAPARIARESYRLDRLRALTTQTARQHTNLASRHLIEIRARISALAASFISRADARMDALSRALTLAAAQPVAMEKRRLDGLKQLVAVLSPESTLQRGYSITRVNGKAVRSAAEVPPGAKIVTTLAQGSVISVAAE